MIFDELLKNFICCKIGWI